MEQRPTSSARMYADAQVQTHRLGYSRSMIYGNWAIGVVVLASPLDPPAPRHQSRAATTRKAIPNKWSLKRLDAGRHIVIIRFLNELNGRAAR